MTHLAEIRDEIRTGDLLLWRPEPGDTFGRAVCVGSGGSEYSHAGMAVWVGPPRQEQRLMSMDMLLGVGGVMQPLGRMVQRWPGMCDHFRANAFGRWPEWDGEAAAQYFIDQFLGLPYGRDNARVAARTRIPFLRWMFYPNRDDQYVAEGPPFCSQAVSEATQFGGHVDSVEELACAFTWPGDLAGSPFYAKTHEALT